LCSFVLASRAPRACAPDCSRRELPSRLCAQGSGGRASLSSGEGKAAAYADCPDGPDGSGSSDVGADSAGAKGLSLGTAYSAAGSGTNAISTSGGGVTAAAFLSPTNATQELRLSGAGADRAETALPVPRPGAAPPRVVRREKEPSHRVTGVE
jgi:hypothetical protein